MAPRRGCEHMFDGALARRVRASRAPVTNAPGQWAWRARFCASHGRAVASVRRAGLAPGRQAACGGDEDAAGVWSGACLWSMVLRWGSRFSGHEDAGRGRTAEVGDVVPEARRGGRAMMALRGKG